MVQRALREVGAEERVEHRARTRPSPTSAGTRRSGPCRGTAGRGGCPPARTRTACRCGRSRSRPRRRSAARRARGTRRRARRGPRARTAACRPRPAPAARRSRPRARARARRPWRTRSAKQSGSRELGRAQHREAQRVEDASCRTRRRRPRARRSCRRGTPRRTRGTWFRPVDAPVHPVLERDLERLLDRARAVGRVEEVRVVDRHDAGQRLGELDHDPVAVAEHRRVRALGELARSARRRARGRGGRAS